MSSDDEKLAQSTRRPGEASNLYGSAQNLTDLSEVDVPQMQRSNTENGIAPLIKPWSPVTLRKWFIIPLLSFMVAVAIALEVALHFSQKKNGIGFSGPNVKKNSIALGWSVTNSFAATTGILHYVYTLPPVGVAMIIIALWAWTDLDIRRQQPYIDLAHGNAPASRSLLLDYSGKHPAIVTASALRNDHYLVAISSMLVLLGLALQPLAAALFSVKSVYGNGPDLTLTSLETPGLVSTFNDFSSFYVAAGYTSASVLYNVSQPQFVNGSWATSAFQLPDAKTISNGTVTTMTTGIHSTGNCVAPDTMNLNSLPNGTAFNLTGNSQDCTASIPISTAGVFPSLQGNIVAATCSNVVTGQSGPVAFWSFFQESSSQSPETTLVFCRPSVQVFNVQATVQVPSGNLLNAVPVSNFSSNITDPNGPLNGQPLNGVEFNLTGVDPGTITRAQATRTALSTAILLEAESLPGGLAAQIASESMMVNITQTLYERYMSTAARKNYFVPQNSHLQATSQTFVSRLFMVAVVTHILVVILLLTAIVGGLVHYFHFRKRDRVVMLREPGTLFSAVAVTANSNLADIVDPYADNKTMSKILKGKRFRMDQSTGRIVMEGDAGYEDLASPTLPRSPMRAMQG